MSSSGTRVPVWLRYLCSTPGWGLGGVDAVWPATRVGEGSVFSSVVTDGMDFDDLTTR